MKVLIAGATGATGQKLVEQCLKEDEISEIHVLHYRKLDLGHSEKIKLHVMDMLDIAELSIPDLDSVFCCVGTTIKKAGSKEAFAKVDKYIPIELAKWTKHTGQASFHIISADGASSKSLFFYNRVKGSMEEAIRALSLPSLYIYAPLLLLAERNESRGGEKAAEILLAILCRIIPGDLNGIRPLKVEDLAGIMLEDAMHISPGCHRRKASDLNKKVRHKAGLS